VPGVRHLAQDRLQDFWPLQGPRARGLSRPARGRRQWQQVIPFFAFPQAVRRITYTTNTIDSLIAKLRRAVRTRGHFPNEQGATKLLFLVLRNAQAEWKVAIEEWRAAKTQFANSLRRAVLRELIKSVPHKIVTVYNSVHNGVNSQVQVW
jgi:hypothetical protein